MMNTQTGSLRLIDDDPAHARQAEQDQLDRVFFALSDPIRRSILERLEERALLVSELAAPFDISLQAVSRHIQVLVRSGLVQQARSGRISRCSIVVGPIFAAAVWINRYSRYWQAQFDTLAGWLDRIGRRRSRNGAPGASKHASRKRSTR